MKAIIIIIIVLLVLFWLYLLCLRCRRGKMDQAYFRQWRYAHRGLHDREKGIPENSMAAFKRAAANGFGAELDVHLMKDGKLAVIHDASLLRTAGADVEIEDLTVEALDQYPLEGTEQRIPLLEEVLPLFTDRAPLIVELKAERGNAAALAAAASRVLKKYKGAYCVESFDPRCLMWLWQNEPDILRGQLSENFTAHGDAQHLPGGIRWILSNLLLNVRTRPDFIAYRFEDRGNLSLRLCRGFYKVQEASWTVRDRETMEKATTGKVKESLFSIIQFDIEGRRVLDLFAGTGQLGIEALSRGAAECVFIDRRADAVKLIQENLALCRLADRARVRQGDALPYLRSGEKFDIVFLDPPYASGLLQQALTDIAAFDICRAHGIIIAESAVDTVLPEMPAPYALYREYKYGKIKLTVYHRGGNEDTE